MFLYVYAGMIRNAVIIPGISAGLLALYITFITVKKEYIKHRTMNNYK
jgi:hypothetical protein